MDVKQQPRTLLAEDARASTLTEMTDCETCCGFGGTFSIKFGDISARMADNKCQHIVDTRGRRRRARRPRLRAQHRRPAAPPRRHDDARAAHRRSRGGQSIHDAARRSERLEMHVASMHFKERAHDSLDDAQLQQNLQKFRGKFVAKRREAMTELDDFEGTRDAAQAIRQRALDNLDTWLEIFEANATARGATVLWAETPADVNRHVLEIARRHGVAQDHQIEVDGQRGVGARPRDRGGRAQGRRDRSRRVHPADQRLRAAVAHHRAGAAQEQGRGRRSVRQGARHAAQARDHRAVLRGAAGIAHALSHRGHGHLGRQFLRRRDRVGRAGDQRGQRDADDDAAEGPRRDLGHREDRADARRRRDAAAPAAALRDRPVDFELRRHPDRHQGRGRVPRRRAHVLHPRRRRALGRPRQRSAGGAAAASAAARA